MPPEKLIPLLMIPIMLVVVLLKNRREAGVEAAVPVDHAGHRPCL